MNSRIEELANEAAKFSAIMALPTGESGDELFVEKFAELIVQECLLAISKTDVTLEEMSVLIKCHDQVEKHFEVEE